SVGSAVIETRPSSPRYCVVSEEALSLGAFVVAAWACSGMLAESEVEGDENQHNSHVHREPSPEPISEEQHIDRNDHGRHQQYVESAGHLDSHIHLPSLDAGDLIGPAPVGVEAHCVASLGRG